MSGHKPPTQEPANNEKNIYIPSFIAAKPFYIGDSESDYLEHQRLKAEPKDTLDKAKWYERGRKLGPAATKYRKGACENCGAMTHKTKECLSRPRKLGAKWTGKDIQADEKVDSIKLGWDAKRDRWNGYDAREYDNVVQEYEELEALRQSAAKSKTPGEQTGEDGEGSDNDDTARYAEETDMGRSQPTSTRQLRLREDTAKYLLNLDLDSARYDPKTRSMDVDASSLQPTESGEFDGFARPAESSSDAAAFERAQQYAWETQERNAANNANLKKLHLQANPTEGEILLRQKVTEDADRETARRKNLLDKYGDASANGSTSSSNRLDSALTNPTMKSTHRPKAVIESTSYVEYDKYGAPKLPKGQIKPQARSKYPEDILTNNHTSIWGSYWADFKWGYACCHSFTRNSYCTGDAGRVAFEEAEGLRTGEGLLLEAADSHNEEEAERRDDNNESKPEAETDSKKTKKKTLLSKRGFTEYQNGGVTEEDMEAYKRSRMAADDPVARFAELEDGV